MANFVINDPNHFWSVASIQTYPIFNATAGTINTNVITLNGNSISGGNLTFVVSGTFSSFGTSVFGTIDDITVRENGVQVASVTNLDLSYTTYITTSTSLIADRVNGGDDSVVITSSRSTSWDLGEGNDTVHSGGGSDFFNGGSGTDRLVIEDSAGNATFDSSGTSYVSITSAEGTDSMFLVEQVEFSEGLFAVQAGGSNDNTLTGRTLYGTNKDLLLGGDGNDNISGLAGHDLLAGEDGNDTITGGGGRDTLQGGEGADRLKGAAGHDALNGGIGNDTLVGGSHRDTLVGDNGNDILRGGHGADVLEGRAHQDVLAGGHGADRLFGGLGNDTMAGQKGNDLLFGGDGSDTFVFHKDHGNDTIGDFALGEDKIRVGRGADALEDLTFEAQGSDVLISFSNVTILVEGQSVNELQDADNFLF